MFSSVSHFQTPTLKRFLVSLDRGFPISASKSGQHKTYFDVFTQQTIDGHVGLLQSPVL